MRRQALTVHANGEILHFFFDREEPTQLHITVRHGTTPADVILVLSDSTSTTSHDQVHDRYTTTDGLLTVLWFRVPSDNSIGVISCY